MEYFDEAGTLVKVQSKYKAVRHGVKTLHSPCRVQTKQSMRQGGREPPKDDNHQVIFHC